MFSIVLAEYLAWHGVGLNRGFARVRRDTEGGWSEIGSYHDDDTKNLRFLSLSLCVRHGGRFC